MVAQENYRALSALDPDSWRVHRALGEIAAGPKQWQDAIDEYRKAIEKQPRDSDLYEALGEACQRLSRFDEVESCYLMSGGYDLLIFVTGPSLQRVASFVSEKLATLEGVISTSTHFMLRSYKEGGFLIETGAPESGRLKVSP